MAIRIQREVGGNLAVLLDTVADTMVKRERIRRELHALTAEGRLSAIVLSLRLAAARARDLAHPAVVPEAARSTTSSASLGLIGAVVLSIVGWFWLRTHRRHRGLR